MNKLNVELLNAQHILDNVIALAKLNQGQPIAIVSEGDEIKIGVMGIYPTSDDWMFFPVPLDQFDLLPLAPGDLPNSNI